MFCCGCGTESEELDRQNVNQLAQQRQAQQQNMVAEAQRQQMLLQAQQRMPPSEGELAPEFSLAARVSAVGKHDPWRNRKHLPTRGRPQV